MNPIALTEYGVQREYPAHVTEPTDGAIQELGTELRAACDARDVAIQASFSHWFSRSEQGSALYVFAEGVSLAGYNDAERAAIQQALAKYDRRAGRVIYPAEGGMA